MVIHYTCTHTHAYTHRWIRSSIWPTSMDLIQKRRRRLSWHCSASSPSKQKASTCSPTMCSELYNSTFNSLTGRGKAAVVVIVVVLIVVVLIVVVVVLIVVVVVVAAARNGNIYSKTATILMCILPIKENIPLVQFS